LEHPKTACLYAPPPQYCVHLFHYFERKNLLKRKLARQFQKKFEKLAWQNLQQAWSHQKLGMSLQVNS
jgi:hypothetical protein